MNLMNVQGLSGLVQSADILLTRRDIRYQRHSKHYMASLPYKRLKISLHHPHIATGVFQEHFRVP